MSEAERNQPSASELAEHEVHAYLAKHPDFIRRHMELLETLEVPHASGGAASLIERQVEVLRGRNRKAQEKLDELIAIARDNEWRVQHLNSLAQTLIRADSVAELVRGLREFLDQKLGVGALFIGVAAEDDQLSGGIQSLPEGSALRNAVDDVFRRGHPICGPLGKAQIEALFPEAGDIAPHSAALVPLGDGEVHGALVLASGDAERFVPEMGTLFLGLMGELVTAACRRHLGESVI